MSSKYGYKGRGKTYIDISLAQATVGVSGCILRVEDFGRGLAGHRLWLRSLGLLGKPLWSFAVAGWTVGGGGGGLGCNLPQSRLGLWSGLLDKLLDGLMDGFLNRLLDGLLDELLDGLLDGTLDGLRDGFLDNLLDGLLSRLLDALVDGFLDGLLGGLLGEFLSGFLSGFLNGLEWRGSKVEDSLEDGLRRRLGRRDSTRGLGWGDRCLGLGTPLLDQNLWLHLDLGDLGVGGVGDLDSLDRWRGELRIELIVVRALLADV